MTASRKDHPKRWTPADDAAFDKAVRKVLPPSQTAGDGNPAHQDGARSPVGDSKRSADSIHKSSHRPQKKG